MPRFQGENFQKNLEIVHKFNEFASKKGVTAGQLCLAWVIAQVNILLNIIVKYYINMISISFLFIYVYFIG
jgi:aryl-alcohol dehydrogenase-like predicted oxidoreductase